LKKTETDQKYEETDLKFEETDQQTRFLKCLKKAETDQIYEETDLQIWGNWSKKKRKPFNSKYWETDTKYSEIPQQFWTFEGFPRISKKTEIPQK